MNHDLRAFGVRRSKEPSKPNGYTFLHGFTDRSTGKRD